MKRDAIISNLFLCDSFRNCINKMEPEHLRDDLKQEVILIICELPEERLFQIVEEKRLEWFAVRTILNLIKSNTSPFYKKYRQFVESYGEDVVYDLESSNNLKACTQHNKWYTEQVLRIQDDSAKEIEERELKEMIEDLALDEIEKWENAEDRELWYAYGLIKLYQKHGNFRAIQAETLIPHSSVYKTIKKAFNQIKSTVENKPVFSKEELRFIQNNGPKIKINE